MLHSHSIHKRNVVAHSITAIPCLPNRSVNAKTPALSITAIPCAKLFLGDLSFHCMDQEIVHEFAKKGFSCHVKIAFDMDGKPRGYGFAYFKTIELATFWHEMNFKESNFMDVVCGYIMLDVILKIKLR